MDTLKAWLQEALVASRAQELPEDAEGYLLGRGMSNTLIEQLGVGVWPDMDTPVPDASFREKYGTKAEYLVGRIVIPMYSPRGQLLGFEARTWRSGDGKNISDFRLPEARWHPVFIGMTPDNMTRIWNGANVWICEGVFDLAPLHRIIPKTDVVLATLRAKLSEQHVTFLQRFLQPHRMVYLVYDRDETGRKQTVGWTDPNTGKFHMGAVNLLKRVSVDCLDVPYQGGKDPGEIWDRGGEAGLRETFKQVLSKREVL